MINDLEMAIRMNNDLEMAVRMNKAVQPLSSVQKSGVLIWRSGMDAAYWAAWDAWTNSTSNGLRPAWGDGGVQTVSALAVLAILEED